MSVHSFNQNTHSEITKRPSQFLLLEFGDLSLLRPRAYWMEIKEGESE